MVITIFLTAIPNIIESLDHEEAGVEEPLNTVGKAVRLAPREMGARGARYAPARFK